MSKLSQLKGRLVRLQQQIQQEETNEKTGSCREIVVTGVGCISDYPIITCPACGEIASRSEAELDPEGRKWVYFDGFCSDCRTSFRIGEVTNECALCHEPFRSDPYYDINEFDHHWCKKDGLPYCTACFMQLFLDGYIDLSSDNPELLHYTEQRDGPAVLDGWDYTFIGYSIDPYRSRLAAKGYQQVAAVKEWDEMKEICQQIINGGQRYLALGLIIAEPDTDVRYIIYQLDTSHA